MLIDLRTAFAYPAEGVDGSAGTVKLGEALDLTAFPTDMGEGYPLYLVILVETAASGGTSINYHLTTAENSALTTNPVDLLTTGAIVIASHTAGAQLLAVPLPKADYKRWLGIRITRVGTVSAGAVRAFLVQDPPSWRAYPEGNN